jgi:hypothetical protein
MKAERDRGNGSEGGRCWEVWSGHMLVCAALDKVCLKCPGAGCWMLGAGCAVQARCLNLERWEGRRRSVAANGTQRVGGEEGNPSLI